MRNKIIATLRVTTAMLFALTITNILPTAVLAATPDSAGGSKAALPDAAAIKPTKPEVKTDAVISTPAPAATEVPATAPAQITTPAPAAPAKAAPVTSAPVTPLAPKRPSTPVVTEDVQPVTTYAPKKVETQPVVTPTETRQPVTVETTHTVYAKALLDHECNAYEWHFIINQVKDYSSAPKYITVNFSGYGSVSVPLSNFTGKVAHYSTTKYLDAKVLGASASVYGGWSGEFNLSHGPCKTDDNSYPSKPVVYIRVLPCVEHGQNDNSDDRLMTSNSQDGQVMVTVKNTGKYDATFYVSLDSGSSYALKVNAYQSESYTFKNVSAGYHKVTVKLDGKVVAYENVLVKECKKEDNDHKKPTLMVKVMPCVEHHHGDMDEDSLMSNSQTNGEVRVTVTNPNHNDATYTVLLDGGQMMTVHVDGNSSKTVTFHNVSVGNHVAALKSYDRVLATEYFKVNKCENEHEHGLMKPTVMVTADTCSVANGATGTVTVKVTNNSHGNRKFTVTLAGMFTMTTQRLMQHQTGTVTFAHVPAGTHTVVASAQPVKFLTTSTQVTVKTCAVVPTTTPPVTPPKPVTTVVRTVPAGGRGSGEVLGAVTVATVTPVGGRGSGEVLGTSTLANTGDSSMVNVIVGFTVIMMALGLAASTRKQHS
jgi:hypothetical protein